MTKFNLKSNLSPLLIILTIFFVANFFIVDLALAEEAEKMTLNIPVGSLANVGVGGNALGVYVQAWFQFLLGVIGIIATVMIMIGGFKYLTSQGDKGKIQDAQNMMISAITGLILAFGSVAILGLVNPNLLTLKVITLDDIEYSGTYDESVGRGEGGHFLPNGQRNLQPSRTEGLTEPMTNVMDFINEATGENPSSAVRPDDTDSEHSRGRALDYPRTDNTDQLFETLIEGKEPIAYHNGWPIYRIENQNIGGTVYPVIRVINESTMVNGEGNCWHIDLGKYGQDY